MDLTILSEELVSALGWSLLHSLWQGALIALVLGVVLLFLQKKSSHLRYTLSISAIVLTLFSFLGTFAYIYGDALAHSASYQQTILVFTESNSYESIIASATENQGIFGVFLDYFNHHLPIIVVVWLLGVLVLSLRFLGGIAYLQRLRHSQNQPMPAHWQEKMQGIAAQINVKKQVQLLESALIKVPMIVGYLKPMILLPIGTVNALSAAEVEAILAHELAHIRRHDYLVNLIQSIIDVLFFYHPAVWWMSSTVRAERENCCDDLALSVTGNSLIIAKALANLEAIRLSTPHLSLAFVGQKNQLLNRISRLLGQPMKKRNNFAEGIIAILIIVVFLTTVNYSVNATNNSEHETTFTFESDTTKPLAQKIIVKADDEQEEIIEEYIIVEREVEEPAVFPAYFEFEPKTFPKPKWVERPQVTVAPKLANKSFFVFPTEPKGRLAIVDKSVNLNPDDLNFPDDLWATIAGDNTFFEFNNNGELNYTLPEGTIFELNTPNIAFSPNAPDAPNALFPNKNKFELKVNVDVSGTNNVIWTNQDTSILDHLDEADIIIIEGDKTIVIRKRGNDKDAIERVRGLVRTRAARGKQSADAALARAKQHQERATRNYERQIKIIERNKKVIEKRAERELERARHLTEGRMKRVEKEAARSKKRLELHKKSAKKRLESEKKRILKQEERLKKQKIKRDELHIEGMKRTNALEVQMIKDGILKEDEKIKTLNVSTKNDKTSIKVNGKKVPEDKVKGYMKILEKE